MPIERIHTPRSLHWSLLRLSLVFAIAVGAMSAPTRVPAASTPRVVALAGGTVVDVDGGPAIPNAVVLIEGERIKSIGPAASIAVPDGATVIPMNNRWLIPGLMNMHVHLGLKLPGAAGNSLINEKDAQQALRMAGNARLSLLAGTTTVRLVGEDHGNDFALKAAIERGEVIGPRIWSAGEIIVPTGGHGSLEVDGPYAMAQAARAQIKQGATWIKTAVSGGIATAIGSIEGAPMTDAEISTLIEVAHRNGVKVTAHNGSSQAALQAIRFGIDGFEHGYHLNEEVLRLMKQKGIWLVPTIVVSQPGAYEFYKKIGSPPWYLERVASTGRDHWAMLQNAIRLGVPIALGTDQFPFEPNGGTTATVREAELYVEAGMTPLRALQAGTTQPAKMLGVEADLGRLKVGQYADIVALSADPLQDIKALRTIDFVMKGGEVVRNDRTSAHP